MAHAACGSESTRNTKENDFFTGGDRVNRDGLKLIIFIEERDSSVWYNIADSNWSHEEISVGYEDRGKQRSENYISPFSNIYILD
jgi:hypothetical protein